MKTELKQCPFCGSKNLSIHHDDYVCSCKISCECGCSVEWADDDIKKDDLEKLVIKKWNNRYPMKLQNVNRPMNPLAVKQFTAGNKGIYHTCANCGKDNLKIRKTCEYCGSDDFQWWSDYE